MSNVITNIKTLVVCCSFVCMSLFTACSQPEDTTAPPEKTRIAKKAKKKKPTIKKKAPEKTAEETQVQEYFYDATGKPDPFVPLISNAATPKRAIPQKTQKPLTPLQKYDLDELALVAIIAKQKSTSAIIEDSVGFGYIVQQGMLIGKKSGVIKKITKHGIIIEEKIYNADGDLEPKLTTLTIEHQD